MPWFRSRAKGVGMGKGLIGYGAIIVLAAGLVMWGVGVHNELVSLDENVNTGWAQVENAYQRRADLIPNLVKTVEGAADFERETLTAVIEARSRATQVQITPDDLNDPATLALFQQAQDGLSSARRRRRSSSPPSRRFWARPSRTTRSGLPSPRRLASRSSTTASSFSWRFRIGGCALKWATGSSP